VKGGGERAKRTMEEIRSLWEGCWDTGHRQATVSLEQEFHGCLHANFAGTAGQSPIAVVAANARIFTKPFSHQETASNIRRKQQKVRRNDSSGPRRVAIRPVLL